MWGMPRRNSFTDLCCFFWCKKRGIWWLLFMNCFLFFDVFWCCLMFFDVFCLWFSYVSYFLKLFVMLWFIITPIGKCSILWSPMKLWCGVDHLFWCMHVVPFLKRRFGVKVVVPKPGLPFPSSPDHKKTMGVPHVDLSSAEEIMTFSNWFTQTCSRIILGSLFEEFGTADWNCSFYIYIL